MDDEKIKECNQIINMFETTFYALKWQTKDDYNWKFGAIVSEYEYILKKLKQFCYNNIGCIEEWINIDFCAKISQFNTKIPSPVGEGWDGEQ